MLLANHSADQVPTIDAKVHSPFDLVIVHPPNKQGTKPANCGRECCGSYSVFSFIAKLPLTSVNFVFLFCDVGDSNPPLCLPDERRTR